MATTAPLTVERYLAEFADDPRWTELVGGEVVVVEPRATHAEVQAEIIAALHAWKHAHPGQIRVYGPTAVQLSDHDLFGPDVVVARADVKLTDRDRLAELPLLCVEIRSPSTWRFDIGRKLATYERAGVPEVWLVDTESRSVLVYRRSTAEASKFDVALELAAGEALSSPRLAGFSVPVERLFS